jgi:hypothetical protein
MNIGDKVRLIHGKEEGIIRKVVNDRLIEIEIEDGFLIPVLKNEVVLIASEEGKNLSLGRDSISDKSESLNDNETQENEGLYFALERRDKILTGWIINYTSQTILFSVHYQGVKEIKGLSHGVLNKFSYAKIEDWSMSFTHHLPLLLIDVLQFYNSNNEYTSPLSKKIDINPSILNQDKHEIPLLKIKGVLIKLNESLLKPDPEIIKNAMFNHNTSVYEKGSNSINKTEEIDLHIETLVDDISGLGNAEILQIQLSHFEKSLEKAVISGIDQIIFIHGIGNGTLQNKIHKKLSQYPHIKYFEDARKEKFGFGATKVHLK